MTGLIQINRLILAVTLSIPLICFSAALVMWLGYWLIFGRRKPEQSYED